MKTFKEFKQMLDEDGAAAGIGGGPTNVDAGIAGTSATSLPGVDPKKKKNSLVLQPMTTRANPNG